MCQPGTERRPAGARSQADHPSRGSNRAHAACHGTNAAAHADPAARDADLDALVLGDPADEQVSAGAAVAAISEQLPRLGDHFHDYQRRAITACAAPAVILAVIFPASWVVGALLALATPAAASGADSASPRPTCATPACCCSTSRPRA